MTTAQKLVRDLLPPVGHGIPQENYQWPIECQQEVGISLATGATSCMMSEINSEKSITDN